MKMLVTRSAKSAPRFAALTALDAMGANRIACIRHERATSGFTPRARP